MPKAFFPFAKQSCFQDFLSNKYNLKQIYFFQVFPSDTNNFYTALWFQIFLSETNIAQLAWAVEYNDCFSADG